MAKAGITSLTGGKQPIRIRGADALSLQLAKKPDDLVKDLDVLAAILGQKAVPETNTTSSLPRPSTVSASTGCR